MNANDTTAIAGGIIIRVNTCPSEPQLNDLCEAVGWERFGDEYAALDNYALTTSGWTADGRLIAWTSIVSDRVRHASGADIRSRLAIIGG